MVNAIERSCVHRSLRDIARRGHDTHEGAAVKVLIADDHRLIIEGVKLKLAELDPAVETVVAMNLDELDRMAATHADSLDLALVDITMPGTPGAPARQSPARASAGVAGDRAVGSEDVDLMRSLMEIGVLGFIPKAYSPDVMLSAIRLVLAGGIYIPPLPSRLRTRLATRGGRGATGGSGTRDRWTAQAADRTPDRCHAPVSQGKPNKLIARDLGISEGTVKIHLRRSSARSTCATASKPWSPRASCRACNEESRSW